MKQQVLIIEDDDALRVSLAQTLELADITALQANGMTQARNRIRANFTGIILSDIRMPNHDGFDVLKHTQDVDSEIPVIFLTGQADVPMALRAMKEGAYEFLEKPCPSERLVEVVLRAIQFRHLVLEKRKLERRIQTSDAASIHFPGTTNATTTLQTELRKVASESTNIHLFGDAGSGKKLAAFTLHSIDETRQILKTINLQKDIEGALISIDGSRNANVSLKNIEFTLPEIERRLCELTSTNPEIRWITTSRYSLTELKEKGIAPELLKKLEPEELWVPSVRHRRNDIPIIFDTILRQTARELDTDMPEIDQPILKSILANSWDGNLVEMREFTRQLILQMQTQSASSISEGLADQMDRFEKNLLVDTLKQHDGKVTQAAKKLDLPRKTLYDRLSKHGLKPKDFKE